MEINRTVEVNERFRFIQEAGDEVRELVYDHRRCNGCGICVYSCPVRAIELSEVHEIAKGMDMPPVIVDHNKCAFCGICYSLCPFNAYKFYINGEKIEKDALVISPISRTEKLEECVECTLCYKACPTNAIERGVFLHRNAIEQKNEISGKLKVDKEKCNLCGICAEFCEVFRMVDKEITPTNPIPYDNILIDDGKCDYCKLCEEICPEDAIKVEGKRIDFKLPEKIAEISVNQELCSYCGYCERVCPYDAIRTIKPMDGSLKLYEKRLEKCDPLGCKACVNICKHNRVWWISDGLHFNEDFCIYCGACENACPYDLIEVRRKCYYSKELVNSPWREAWDKALDRVMSKATEDIKARFLEEISEVVEEAEIVKPKRRSVKKIKEAENILKTYKKLENILKNPGYRKAFEKGNAEILLRVVRRYAENKSKKQKA
jgi:4Fe-4S ferredoxin